MWFWKGLKFIITCDLPDFVTFYFVIFFNKFRCAENRVHKENYYNKAGWDDWVDEEFDI